MLNQKRVLACVDRSEFADGVADYAAWAATRLSLPLEFLHVIDRHPETASTRDRSGAIGFGAHESLLDALTSDDEARSRAWREEGRALLNRLRARAKAAGVESSDVRQRYGHLLEALGDLESEVHLFVLGRRGESAERTQRDLGRNIEGVVRGLHSPVLAATGAFSAPKRVMIAFDGSNVARRCVGMVASSPLFAGLPVHLLMSGQRDAARAELAAARTTLEASGFDTSDRFMPGNPEAVIAKAIDELGIDILIMGAYSHSRFRGLVMGSKTSHLLRAARIPVLLVR